MTWTAPPTVATGQIYTAAMFNIYTRDNPLHLWTLLGSGDPGSANKILLSTGAASGTWTTLPDVAMTNQKVNKFNPQYNPGGTFAGILAEQSGFIQIGNPAGIADAPVPAEVDWYVIQVRYPNLGLDYRWQITSPISNPSNTYVRGIINGAPQVWSKLWTAANDGAGSGLDADTVDTLQPGNATNNIAVNNGAHCVNLAADLLDGFHAGNAFNQIPVNNSVVNAFLNADMVDTHHAADITPQQARVWFATVAELTAAGAHWTRDDSARGRLVVAADEGGVVLPYNIQPNTNYGTAWNPTTGLVVGVGGLDVAGNTGTNFDVTAPIQIQVVGSGGVSHALGHQHPSSTLSISGSPSLSGVGATWFPPMYGVVWGRKI